MLSSVKTLLQSARKRDLAQNSHTWSWLRLRGRVGGCLRSFGTSFLLLVSSSVLLLGQPALAVVTQSDSFGKSNSRSPFRTAQDRGDCCLVQFRPYGTVIESLVAQEIRAMKRVFMPYQALPAHRSHLLRPSAEVIQSPPVILDLP